MTNEKNKIAIEVKIIELSLNFLESKNFLPVAFDDGGDDVEKCNDKIKIIEAINSVGTCTIFFQNPVTKHRGWILYICGNDRDIISDNSVSKFPEWNNCIDNLMDETEKLVAEFC